MCSLFIRGGITDATNSPNHFLAYGEHLVPILFIETNEACSQIYCNTTEEIPFSTAFGTVNQQRKQMTRHMGHADLSPK